MLCHPLDREMMLRIKIVSEGTDGIPENDDMRAFDGVIMSYILTLDP